MSVSKRTRFEVFKRDLFACQYCGRTPPTVTLECDHIVAVANGGGDRQDNLLTSCFDCNRGKSDVALDCVPSPLAEQIAQREERAAQVKAYNRMLAKLRRDEDDAIRRLAVHWCNRLGHEKDSRILGDNCQASIRIFLKNLTEFEVLDKMDLALSRIPNGINNDANAWKYFCGCCWRTIKGDGDGPRQKH